MLSGVGSAAFFSDVPCGNFRIHICFRLGPKIFMIRVTSFPSNSEINQFHLTCFGEQYVAGFNVTMRNRAGVQVLESVKDLMYNPFRYQEKSRFKKGIVYRVRGRKGSERCGIQKGCQRVWDVRHPHPKVTRALIMSQQPDYLWLYFKWTIVSAGSVTYVWTREGR